MQIGLYAFVNLILIHVHILEYSLSLFWLCPITWSLRCRSQICVTIRNRMRTSYEMQIQMQKNGINKTPVHITSTCRFFFSINYLTAVEDAFSFLWWWKCLGNKTMSWIDPLKVREYNVNYVTRPSLEEENVNKKVSARRNWNDLMDITFSMKISQLFHLYHEGLEVNLRSPWSRFWSGLLLLKFSSPFPTNGFRF